MQALSPKLTAVFGRRLFYRDISFLDWISTFIYKEICEKFQPDLITGMNPKASCGVLYIVPLGFARVIIRITLQTSSRLVGIRFQRFSLNWSFNNKGGRQ